MSRRRNGVRANHAWPTSNAFRRSKGRGEKGVARGRGEETGESRDEFGSRAKGLGFMGLGEHTGRSGVWGVGEKWSALVAPMALVERRKEG